MQIERVIKPNLKPIMRIGTYRILHFFLLLFTGHSFSNTKCDLINNGSKYIVSILHFFYFLVSYFLEF